MNSDARMISRQGEIITELRAENIRLSNKVDQYYQAYKMYMLLQAAIIGNDQLMDAWQSFIATAILINPNIEGIDSSLTQKGYSF